MSAFVMPLLVANVGPEGIGPNICRVWFMRDAEAR